MQVRSLALALGLLMQHGVHGWGFILAQACKPHPPSRFWRLASRAEMKVHVLLLMQAIEVWFKPFLVQYVELSYVL